jgi:hypothetical protein
MGSGKGAPVSKPTAEYQQYINSHTAQNPQPPKTKWGFNSRSELDEDPVAPHTVGEFTGTTLFSEQEYYADKVNKQQQEYLDRMEKQQEDFAAGIKQTQDETRQQMEAQAAELAERRKEEYRQSRVSSRDAMISDRLSAEDAAVNYVNNQIDKERSNASLFGIDYKIDQSSKDKRISDYFSSVWGEGDESNLNSLFEEVGTPEGFGDFKLKRGTPAASPEENPTNKVVSSSSGIRNRGNNRLLSILDDGDSSPGGNNRLLSIPPGNRPRGNNRALSILDDDRQKSILGG